MHMFPRPYLLVSRYSLSTGKYTYKDNFIPQYLTYSGFNAIPRLQAIYHTPHPIFVNANESQKERILSHNPCIMVALISILMCLSAHIRNCNPQMLSLMQHSFIGTESFFLHSIGYTQKKIYAELL